VASVWQDYNIITVTNIACKIVHAWKAKQHVLRSPLASFSHP